MMFPKSTPARSEPYKRLVVQYPCRNCWIDGYSQAAHPPPKGKGAKEDDRLCFPLCCARPGNVGCHYLFDQYKLMPKDDMETCAALWAAEIRREIMDSGEWPKGLERMEA